MTGMTAFAPARRVCGLPMGCDEGAASLIGVLHTAYWNAVGNPALVVHDCWEVFLMAAAEHLAQRYGRNVE
jgi:hypothetical protein